MREEIWKLFDAGSTNRKNLFISNNGNIKTVTKKNSKVKYIKSYNRGGVNSRYLSFGYIDGNSKKKISMSLHRSVALLFVPNPYNKPHVNHLDNNPLNNCDWNLEWVTNQENSDHRWFKLACDETANMSPCLGDADKEIEYR